MIYPANPVVSDAARARKVVTDNDRASAAKTLVSAPMAASARTRAMAGRGAMDVIWASRLRSHLRRRPRWHRHPCMTSACQSMPLIPALQPAPWTRTRSARGNNRMYQHCFHVRSACHILCRITWYILRTAIAARRSPKVVCASGYAAPCFDLGNIFPFRSLHVHTKCPAHSDCFSASSRTITSGCLNLRWSIWI